MKLFVAGLPGDFDDVDFKEMFELYGTVASAKVIIDHNTQKSKGFGFLDIPNQAEAQSIISTLNGVKMAGKPLVIKEATEQAQRPATGGGGGFRPQRNDGQRPRYNNNREGGYSRDNGGYNRDNNGGGYNRDNGGGYNRSYNRDNNGGGYNRERDNNRDYNRDRSNDGNRY